MASIMNPLKYLAKPCKAPRQATLRTATPPRRLTTWRSAPRATPTPADSSSGQVSTSDKVVYQGNFGAWSIEPSDLVEVWTYRVGISVTAAAWLYCGAYALLPLDPPTKAAMQGGMDAVCLAGACGLGVSLVQIHIYITLLKRALQVLWGVGLTGGLYLVATQDAPAALYVWEHPWAVWLVGPLFAALTGVCFKEGLCYNKPEAAGLFGAIPLLTAGHLTGLLPRPQGEEGVLAAVCLLLAVFAARKYTQPVKDDIGDKSVFMFYALSEAEQQRLLQRRSGQ